mgnify:CR=1 FL=1
MAISTISKSTLQLVLNDGLDPESGEIIFKTKNFPNVKTTATPDGLHAVANAFASLQERSLDNIIRKDDSEILES